MKFLIVLLEKMWAKFRDKILNWIKDKLMQLYYWSIVFVCVVVGFALFYTFVWRLLICGCTSCFGATRHRRKRNRKHRELQPASKGEKAREASRDYERYVQKEFTAQENIPLHLGHLNGWLPHWRTALHTTVEPIAHFWNTVWIPNLLKGSEWAAAARLERMNASWNRYGKPHDHPKVLQKDSQKEEVQ